MKQLLVLTVLILNLLVKVQAQQVLTIYGVEKAMDLKTIGFYKTNQQIHAIGHTSKTDGLGGTYYMDNLSTATADDWYVIARWEDGVPLDTGRWIRILDAGIDGLPAYPTRALNTSYRPSMTNRTEVKVTVRCTPTLTIAGGTSTTFVLQVSPNNSTWTNVSSAEAALTGVAVAINMGAAAGGVVTGTVPAGYYYRVSTTSSGSGLNNSIVSTQETPQ